MKHLIPTILVMAFLAPLTLSLDFSSAGKEPRLAFPIPRWDADVRDSASDSVSHPFSDSPEALFLGEIESS